MESSKDSLRIHLPADQTQIRTPTSTGASNTPTQSPRRATEVGGVAQNALSDVSQSSKSSSTSIQTPVQPIAQEDTGILELLQNMKEHYSGLLDIIRAHDQPTVESIVDAIKAVENKTAADIPRGLKNVARKIFEEIEGQKSMIETDMEKIDKEISEFNEVIIYMEQEIKNGKKITPKIEVQYKSLNEAIAILENKKKKLDDDLKNLNVIEKFMKKEKPQQPDQPPLDQPPS